MTNKKLPTKDDVQPTPTDETREATITGVEITTWAEVLKNNENALSKFDNPEQEIVQVRYETKEGFTGKDALVYHELPPQNSLMGRFLTEYGSFDEGTQIKVYFNSDGYASLKDPLYNDN